VCSLYLPPSIAISGRDLDALVSSLPQPFLLLGDFNAHHPLWGSSTPNSRGNDTHKFIVDNNLALLNTGPPTFISCQGYATHIDLSLCSQSLLTEWTWSRIDDLHSSDHFPLLLECDRNPPRNHTRRPRCVESRADWAGFQNELDLTEISSKTLMTSYLKFITP
jgi:hypothetical protein